jgi:hypothetical protein
MKTPAGKIRVEVLVGADVHQHKLVALREGSGKAADGTDPAVPSVWRRREGREKHHATHAPQLPRLHVTAFQVSMRCLSNGHLSLGATAR